MLEPLVALSLAFWDIDPGSDKRPLFIVLNTPKYPSTNAVAF